MRDVESELTISPSAVENVPFYVIEHAGRIVGFYSLSSHGDGCADLTDLFVDPDFARRRIGTRLLAHARQLALLEGHRSLLIHSDPHAEPFYRSAGAVYAGEAPSGSIAGRMLPLMRIDLD
jgi:GNAT superfamily N-acetyltransferase